MDHIIAAIHQAAQQQQQQLQQQQQMFQSPPMPLMHLQFGGDHVYRPPMDYYGPMGNHCSPGRGPQEQEQGHGNDDDDDEDDEDQRTIYCGNLDERVTEEILYEIFLQAGPIENVRIPLDPAGRQRNFGFVTYHHVCAVPFALELYQGLELFQKKVTMKGQGNKQATSREQDQQQYWNRNAFNPFMSDTTSSGALRHPRHSLHDAKPYDRQQELRRRSDSAILDRNRSTRQQQQQQNFNHNHHNPGGSRRSEQRSHGKRRF